MDESITEVSLFGDFASVGHVKFSHVETDLVRQVHQLAVDSLARVVLVEFANEKGGTRNFDKSLSWLFSVGASARVLRSPDFVVVLVGVAVSGGVSVHNVWLD